MYPTPEFLFWKKEYNLYKLYYLQVTNNHEEITKSTPVAGKLFLSCYHEIRRENIIHSQLRNNASKLDADHHKDFIKSFLFVITVDFDCDIKKLKSAADPQTKIHHLE